MKEKAAEKSRNFDFEKRLARYALVGSAALGMPLYAGTIQPVNSITATPGSNSSQSMTFSFDGGTDTAFTLFADLSLQSGTNYYKGYVSVSSGPGTNIFGTTQKIEGPITVGYPTAFSSAANAQAGLGGSVADGDFKNKLLGMIVESTPGQYRTYYSNRYTDNFQNNSSAYLGMTFQIGQQEYLGWADILIQASNAVSPSNQPSNQPTNANTANTSVTVTILDSGDVEATPEPSSLALFALGAAGVAAVRRKRSKLS